MAEGPTLPSYQAARKSEVPMNVVIKIFNRSIVGVFTLGLLGCGCLFPYKSNTVQNLYVDLHSEAEDLRYDGKYRAAVEKYEQAFKYRPRSTKVIDVSYIALFKYRIAFCYAKLADAETDISLYIKAEEVIKESYQTAILESDQAEILYLWGYILFKQERYQEARAKYEEAIDILLRQRRGHYLTVELYALGKVCLALGDEGAARRVFAQLETRINDIEYDIMYRLGQAYMALGDEGAARRVFAQLEARDYVGYDIMYRLGQAYMALDDAGAARRVFAQLEAKIDAALQSGFPYIADELYRLGQAYMESDDEVAARHTFAQLLKHYPKSSYKAEIKRLLEKQ
jgi:tetratricopeptide (TPR) repeat protein